MFGRVSKLYCAVGVLSVCAQERFESDIWSGLYSLLISKRVSLKHVLL